MEHRIPSEVPDQVPSQSKLDNSLRVAPVDTVDYGDMDSVSRAVSRMMRVYFHTIDSSLRTNSQMADSPGFPRGGFMKMLMEDSAKSLPAK